VNVNAQRPVDNRTPLHIACAEGHLQIVKMLANHCSSDENPTSSQGGDFTIPDSNGEVALLAAVKANQATVVKYLLSPQYNGSNSSEDAGGTRDEGQATDLIHTSSATERLSTDWAGVSPGHLLRIAEAANVEIVDRIMQKRKECGESVDEVSEKELEASNAMLRTLTSRAGQHGPSFPSAVHKCFDKGLLYWDWLRKKNSSSSSDIDEAEQKGELEEVGGQPLEVSVGDDQEAIADQQT